MESKKVVKADVQALKYATGWSTREMANYLGVTDRAVQMWLAGTRSMPRYCYELALIRVRLIGSTPAHSEVLWNDMIKEAEHTVRKMAAQINDDQG